VLQVKIAQDSPNENSEQSLCQDVCKRVADLVVQGDLVASEAHILDDVHDRVSAPRHHGQPLVILLTFHGDVSAPGQHSGLLDHDGQGGLPGKIGPNEIAEQYTCRNVCKIITDLLVHGGLVACVSAPAVCKAHVLVDVHEEVIPPGHLGQVPDNQHGIIP